MKISDRLPRWLRYTPDGLISLPIVRELSVWWPVLTAIIYGTFFIFDERRNLHEAYWVWQFGRGGILVVSIICLIRPYSARWRDHLGHMILGYCGIAATSYWFALPDHDSAFWGEQIRLIAIGLLLWILTLISALALREQKIKELVSDSRR